MQAIRKQLRKLIDLLILPKELRLFSQMNIEGDKMVERFEKKSLKEAKERLIVLKEKSKKHKDVADSYLYIIDAILGVEK